MKCVEAAEFVSALCDGQQIPREAAEHIATCETCRALLHEYLEIGAELRRVASLTSTDETKNISWEGKPQHSAGWWEKASATMRIPKLAFALLLVSIVALGSSLVVVKARTNTAGQVLLLTVTARSAEPVRCGVYASGPHMGEPCGFMVHTEAGELQFSYHVIENEGDQLSLSVRSRVVQPQRNSSGSTSVTLSLFDMMSLPEKHYTLEPGKDLKIEIDGLGTAILRGELLDHMPVLSSGAESLVPEPGELRLLSPILLQEDHVVFNFGGSTTVLPEKDDWAVEAYVPSVGRFVIAQVPFEGAVEGHVDSYSLVHFELRGQKYELVTGAPITRAETIWIRNDPNFRPSKQLPGASDDSRFVGNLKLDSGLAKPQ
jgi:hypothetical protein